jgi:hypothetical protein
MFIIILWLLLHAKRNYRKERGKKIKKTYIEKERERENVTLAISAGLSNDIIILYRDTHTHTHIHTRGSIKKRKCSLRLNI